PPPLSDLSFTIPALVFPAMREGADLRIDGPVSKSLLRNIEAFQEIWSVMVPDYRQVDIRAAEERDDLPSRGDNSAVVAVSGGLDGYFTFLRHWTGRAGRRNRSLKAALLVHGFDIPLGDEDAFAIARHDVAAALDDAGVPVVT